MSNKSVLVSGGAGYIGTHTCISLLEAGWDVVVIDNLDTGVKEQLPEAVTFYEADVGDYDHTLNVLMRHGCRSIIHFAGFTVVPESVTDPLKYYRNNTCVSRSLIEASIAAGIESFIFSSTAAVYGDPETLPVTEDEPVKPLTPYGTSKLMTEYMLRDVAAATDLKYVALRYFNVAGADPQGRTGQSTPNATHLIKVACEVAAGQRPSMQIFGDDYDTIDGTCVRDFIHVTDLADAHVAALDYLRDGGESQIMNCGYGRGFSVRQVVDIVGEISGAPINAVVGPRREGDIVDICAATDRLRSVLGWVPKHDDLHEIISSAYAWENRER
ncbi:UDP-glucose 4-epimerase GalE [Magnetospira sp. QH-2]|uniref:UDP-glucose 4-epimerase GalE n=1 Tax=Magnetospira sp. (strain QH-2) TaxID=1288970 RepID=UPI0003E80B33|nr:UDP-glucose 4-epimerase GalE [Magnetospira sp. QH-2]CCQ73103.1 UDP-glucose 4-epimerase [Magnetospira sp. QH-2]